LPYTAWKDVLGNPALTAALLSRLQEKCYTVKISGPRIRPRSVPLTLLDLNAAGSYSPGLRKYAQGGLQ
jgi:hypothetical protein